jgi:signal transduction histidine kinase
VDHHFQNEALLARIEQERDRAVEQMAATAEVLQIISQMPESLSAVFSTLLLKALQLCHAEIGILFTYDGDKYTAAAMQGTSPEFSLWLNKGPIRAGEHSGLGRIATSHQIVHVKDIVTEDIYRSGDPLRLATADLGGARTFLAVPMMKADHLVGAFTIYRQDVCPFDQAHIDLVKSFSSQAVIAIENVRLINETREALERQTATADILKVIASSPSDVQPVFEAIADRSNRLVGGHSTAVYRFLNETAELVAFTRVSPEGDEVLRRSFPRPLADHPLFQLVRGGDVIQIRDTESDLGVTAGVQSIARARGFRSLLLTPLASADGPIGLIAVTRKEIGTFADHHVQLLRTFADQAVIAISNVKLFQEVQERTRDLSESLQQQTATAEVLKVISSSPGELEPVFQALLENAVHLCEAEFAMLFLYEENEFRAVGKWNLPPAYSEFLGKYTVRADPMIPLGRAAITKQPVQVADILLDQSYIKRHPGIVAVAEGGGARTLLQVPMLKENELVGTIGVYRQEVRPFSDKQVTLVQNFAAQAVIAIENASLLNELRQRTDDLTRSLNDLRTAQDRLIQTEKLASLGQLTAGIAHEIKNPLNFVNNFSALSAELVGEMNDVLAGATLDKKTRGELDELAQTLKSNLEKVVQHGKRADSIVKNMLQHSREGSGEHRPTDINAIVDESLNLAYHGARAEKAGFSIAFQRDLDPSVGMADIYPQEITRVLLNLISNGFYATTKRRAEVGDGFEPMLSAATKNLGDKVEIRIRDNGTGIPEGVKEKIFNPFFTTKPSGEGTGLGLSMSHDIIVKQHGGSIDVETEPGVFTEFKIVLPRASQF